VDDGGDWIVTDLIDPIVDDFHQIHGPYVTK
jgi:hypothetical protein